MLDRFVDVRVGTDVQSITEVQASWERWGERYTRRLFTDHELAICGGPPATAAPRLAARFAAKEAVLKLLAPVKVAPPWRSIEIRTTPGGAPQVRLTGEAAELADRQGIGKVALSLSHGAGIATATAVALVSSAPVGDGARSHG